jgi:hypothetical protein
MATDEERSRFDLLNRAYVEARYDPSYAVDAPVLEQVYASTLAIRQLAESACQSRI